MRIKSSDIIADQPILTIRKLLQKNSIWDSIPLEAIEKELEVSPATARQIYQDLCELGYIAPTDKTDREPRWRVTEEGNRLIAASARKPIKRKTAERLVQQFLERVKTVNHSNEYAFQVKQVIIFGSYVSNSPNLGDIDFAITLEPKYSDQDKQQVLENERREKAIKVGKHFNTFFEELAWPEIEVRRFLKNRSPSISLHNPQTEKKILETTPTILLYEAPAQ
jgi:DNA-binding transcriptional regulator YhcF (GntR family)